MSWMSMLYKTYENCESKVGKSEFGETPLLPISHTTQIAQLEAMITEDGEWVDFQARVLPKEEGTTIIPCTEDSATRSGTFPPPHPLFDKLQYLAGDYERFGGEKGMEFYKRYISQLEDWHSSDFSIPQIRAVLKYLKKGTLIADLVREGILHCGDDGKLLDKWNGAADSMPQYFKSFSISQKDAFIRFRVKRSSGKPESVWLSESVWNSFIGYYRSCQSDRGLCYVQGTEVPCTEKAPSKIRNSGDKAKLISANDSTGFTYRGRFKDRTQALAVGYETSQKAHNALRWLLDKKGHRNGEQAFVAWGIEDQPMPPFMGDGFDMLIQEELAGENSTREEYAERFRKSMAGYGSKLGDNDDVVVMGVDSATPGRLSVIYYRELKGSELLGSLNNWHSTCCWHHQYKKVEDGKDEKGKPKNKYVDFYGAPAPEDIVFAAYGSSAGDKLKKATVERLLPCIIDRAAIPSDIVRCAAARGSNPVAMEPWEYKKTLSIACALIRKYYNDKEGEKWSMSIEQTNDRSYLFGRLLACAHALEAYALFVAGEKGRQTNAERYHCQFSKRPSKTWVIINERLDPYIKRLGSRANRYQNAIIEITDKITFNNFTNDALSEVYLLGYASQLQYFKESRKASDDNGAQEEKTNNEEMDKGELE
ncbi:CRISPR-associated Csd1 family protein [Anaerobacterium chartisolvens]|uniref:CRISPR-associated Csd1 family protein n=1 Tax=Anaerobacterium chartisolvens TaxID=1297424 RepID=A0A369BEY2_9FIRM|nr:type I-C CRISPR-associated protein Cas8c/Csd1 [Anaerobacterium chartisolvens]RCX20103.1 CRISPR-associated Csd1 family protein [Anaerobacterium chartisolvens]